MADMQAFEFLCRVCAVDTKGKSSVAECVYVLKTTDLRDKMKKYLDLTVSEGDALPKVICKSCYRSVEGIVSLSKIAVHTQMVLSNFLRPRVSLIEPDAEFTTIVSPVPDYERVLGGGNAAAAAKSLTPPKEQQQQPPSNEKPKRVEDVIVNVSVSDPLTRETQQKIIGASRQRQQNLIDSRFIPKSIAHRHVSFAGAIIGAAAATSTPKDSQTTPTTASQTSTPPVSITRPHHQQETPKATATPKTAATPPATASDNAKNVAAVGGGGGGGGGAAAGVINFFNSQKPQQQVTVSSGGYVIGQMNASSNISSSTNNTPRAAAGGVGAAATTPPQDSKEQQNKRINRKFPSMKNVPRNVASTGQISLLKVSHKTSSLVVNPSLSNHTLSSDASSLEDPAAAKSTTAFNRPRAISPPVVRKPRRPQRRPTIAEIPSAVEALPREIIIAGVKKPKHKSLPMQQTQQQPQQQPLPQPQPQTQQQPQQQPLPPTPPSKPTIAARQKTPPTAAPSPPQIPAKTKPTPAPRRSPEIAATMPPQLLQQQHTQQQQPPVALPKSLFADDIPLGRVIRDFDLLKLIMKALKWPVIKENMDAQLERLRNSKFTTVMSDPNLLQDTDLTQLLGPYLAPVMIAAQKLQQQQNAVMAAMSTPASASAARAPKAKSPIETATDLSATSTTNLASAIPYRLPPETSVQLVPASPEEEAAAAAAAAAKRNHQHKSRKSALPHKRSRRAPQATARSREVSIVISDGEDDELDEPLINIKNSQTSCLSKNDKSNTEKPKKSVTIADPPTSSLEALKQLSERSRASLEHLERMRSGNELTAYQSLVEDIVLLETEATQAKVDKVKPQESLPSVISMTSADNLFTARAVPPITRPIIKRRKTVITNTTANKDADKSSKLEATASVASVTAAEKANKEQANANDNEQINKLNAATSMSFFSGVTAHITGGSGTAAAVSSSPSTATVNESPSTTLAAAKDASKESKDVAAVSSKKSLSTKAALAEQLLEAVGLKKSSGTAVDKAPSRESVQQIRSALKRSLKQAVEQNLRKHEEQPVKQVADSTTTKSDANKSADAVDIEDEIEKVTLHKKTTSSAAAAATATATRQISLLKSNKSQMSMKAMPAASRSTNRLNRKSVAGVEQASSQKPSEADEELDKDEIASKAKSSSNSQQEEDSHSLKSSFAQTSPVTSEADLGHFVNKVSSTSDRSPEIKTEDDKNKTQQADKANEIAKKSNNRKRRAIEETGGDGADITEEAKKKELKTEQTEAKPCSIGDNEDFKDTISYTELDSKSESSFSLTSRPSRASKTSSRYYKGPDKQTTSTRPTRSTRNK